MSEAATWEHALVRDARTYGATLLHGEVADHLPDRSGALRPIAAWLVDRLVGTERPFDHALAVHPDGALDFERPTDAAAFGRRWSDGAAPDPSDAYDLGPLDDAPPPTTLAPGELLAGLASRPGAFGGWLLVFDWGHLATAAADRLSDADRALALAVSRLVQASAEAAHAGQATPHLVLVARQLGAIPTAMYLGDPRFRRLTVPRPALDERRTFFERSAAEVRCATPKGTPGDRRPDRVLRTEALAALTDGLSYVDLAQLVTASRATPEPLAPDALLNLYRYGDQRSPWEQLDEVTVRGAEAALGARVFGQDRAVAHVATMIRRAWLGLSGLQHAARSTTPKGKLFFVGPTGVGKTELAKALAALLFGDERACLRFDMSEYNHEHSDQRLVGAPPGYVGYEAGGQLTNAVRARPFSVLLFDEIEKAHPRILDKFLQILEDGRLTDGRGDTAWFGETVILFTSNLGAANVPAGADEATLDAHFQAAVEAHFNQTLGRPELLNRLGDHIVPFGQVRDAQVRMRLLVRKLEPITEHLRARYGVRLRLTEAARARLLADARLAHGGRGLLNAIERRLIDPLSAFLLDHLHQLGHGRLLVADAEPGAALAFELIDG